MLVDWTRSGDRYSDDTDRTTVSGNTCVRTSLCPEHPTVIASKVLEDLKNQILQNVDAPVTYTESFTGGNNKEITGARCQNRALQAGF